MAAGLCRLILPCLRIALTPLLATSMYTFETEGCGSRAVSAPNSCTRPIGTGPSREHYPMFCSPAVYSHVATHWVLTRSVLSLKNRRIARGKSTKDLRRTFVGRGAGRTDIPAPRPLPKTSPHLLFSPYTTNIHHERSNNDFWDILKDMSSTAPSVVDWDMLLLERTQHAHQATSSPYDSSASRVGRGMLTTSGVHSGVRAIGRASYEYNLLTHCKHAAQLRIDVTVSVPYAY